MGYYDRHPEREARDRRQHAWMAFRRKLGLSDTTLVAKLLDVSTRSIERYEQAEQPPAWYQVALLGLIETFPDRAIAQRARPRGKKKKTSTWASRYEPLPPEPKCPYRTWDPEYYKSESIPR